ncbi:MAG: PEP-CTERM sorting domain-containing protein, partial [Rubrivivax sp.]|nr:PEP-CTERM sorting domain-containing protein [Rubrivivax sp.]
GSWNAISSGNALPAAISIGGGFLPPTAIAPLVGNIETAPGYVLQPTAYSMDFYEAMEGMRISLPSAISSGPSNTGTGETALYASAQAFAPGTFTSDRGGLVIAPGQFNGHRIIIDNRITATPSVNSGAQLSNVTGVLDYSFNNYKLLVTETPTVVSNGLTRESAVIPTGHFGLASYNVENLGGTAAPARFTAIAGQIAGNLGAPHLISLQEIQDNNGATNNGVVAADVTLNTLATALNSATGRSYAWVTVNGINNADGGQPGGNIRQAFMYDTSRVSFAGVVGGALDAVSAIATVDGQIQLNLGAGRIDPTNPAFTNSRKPLVTEFKVDGQQIIVIANHFNSKGGDQPLYGPTQPPINGTETQRLAQATAVGSFVAGLLAINPNANIVVTGDLNDFQFASSLAPLAAAGLTNLTHTLAAGDRYSYSFEGNLQTLDHMWVSSNLLNASGLAYDVVHANAEFIDQVSDHDPILMTMSLVPAPVPEPATWLMMVLGLAALVARRARA